MGDRLAVEGKVRRVRADIKISSKRIMKPLPKGYKENIFVSHYFPKVASLIGFIKKAPTSVGARAR
jgi:hypothetical protein